MKQDQTYEIPYFGDLFLLSKYHKKYKKMKRNVFRYALLPEKKALIFWVENSAGKQNVMAYSPVHLGGVVDSEIPLLASYNGWHYQVQYLLPLDLSVSARTELTLNS